MNDSGFISAGSSFVSSGSDTPQHAATQSILKILKSRIFLGRYVERRLVNESVGYRDIVIVSPAEEELHRDLLEVTLKLVKLYPAHFIGITNTTCLGDYKPGVCLWTEIDDKPLGPFWFQIKSVQFRSNEILVQVKCLRHITDRFIELEPFLLHCRKPKQGHLKTPTTESVNIDFREVMTFCIESLTFNNLKDAMFVLIASIIGIVTGGAAFISYIGTFVLSLVKEFSNLIHNSTPLLLGCLDFISKIIGGFYILVAMIFRQNNPTPTSRRSIEQSRETYNKNDYSNFELRDFD